MLNENMFVTRRYVDTLDTLTLNENNCEHIFTHTHKQLLRQHPLHTRITKPTHTRVYVINSVIGYIYQRRIGLYKYVL
jgi:hypothetical protein